MHSKDLIGKEVISSDAWRVGTITWLMIDPNTWQVTSVEVGLDDTIVQEIRAKGLTGASSLVVPIDRIEGITDKATLRMKKEELPNLVTQPPTQRASTQTA
jgi:sporulation protein YlmC with PRC-barrel domain